MALRFIGRVYSLLMCQAFLSTALGVAPIASGQELLPVLRDLTHDSVSPLTFSRDDALLAAVHRSGGLGVWDVDAGKELRRLPVGEQTHGHFAAFMPDNSNLALYSPKIGGVVFWDFRTGAVRRQRNDDCAHGRNVLSVAFSPERDHVASAEVVRLPKCTVRLQRVADAGLVAEFPVGGVVRQLAFTPDGNALLATEEKYDNRQKCFVLHTTRWDLKGDKGPVRYGPFPVTGYRVSRVTTRSLGRYVLASDGRRLVTTLPQNGVLLIDTETGQQVKTGLHPTTLTFQELQGRPIFGNRSTLLTGLAFTPAYYHLATGAVGSSDVCFWPCASNAGRFQLTQPDVDEVQEILFSDSGSLMAVRCAKDQQLKTLVWRLPSGTSTPSDGGDQ